MILGLFLLFATLLWVFDLYKLIVKSQYPDKVSIGISILVTILVTATAALHAFGGK